MAIPLFVVENLKIAYNNNLVIKDICFSLNAHEIVTLIGANGSGKTTILKACMGLLKPLAGSIHFKGVSLIGLNPDQIVLNKISLVPEGRGIFLNLTVQENLDLGAWTSKLKFFQEDLELVFSYFPLLKERKKQNAGTLSGGEQQMLAIGRALMARPEILLLDEPSLGLAPKFIEKIFQIIKDINKKSVTILLIEQNAKQALQIANRGIIIEAGRIIAHEVSTILLNSDLVKKAYLGEF